eukprot:TRINITY_DN4989_c0_g1_i16.p1 TRINITY_DN4989_c0_g1~~TRINITY_DN4989_c0_g1_i16.p1  ORF type:complete len:368 (+),score=60.06 TRINITY_DN4989_c0_g1_i16:58-1161(+)
MCIRDRFYRDRSEQENEEFAALDSVFRSVEQENLHEKFRGMAFDRNATEDFIQSFILENAPVILLVVSQLTRGDQNFIRRVGKRYARKRIVVIHNFHEICVIRAVEDLIVSDIQEAFAVTQAPLNTQQIGKNRRIWCGIRVKGNETGAVDHLVMAREDTEAGRYFNPTTIEYIKRLLQSDARFEVHNLVNDLLAYARGNLHRYSSNKTSSDIEKNLEFNQQKALIRLKGSEPFKTKEVEFDTLGDLVNEGPYHPPYTTASHPNRYEVYIDLPRKLTKVRPSLESMGAYEYLKFSALASLGEIPADSEAIVLNNRRDGVINLVIKLGSIDARYYLEIQKPLENLNGVIKVTVLKRERENDEFSLSRFK